MAEIRIEGKPVVGGATDQGHLYLVYIDDNGSQYVIRGGLASNFPFGLSSIVTEVGVPMYGADGVFGTDDDSEDARDNTGSAMNEHGSRVLDLAGRDPATVWKQMKVTAQRINDAGIDYDILGPNSNTLDSNFKCNG